MSIADEIKKYKELLDSGIITQEEFNLKKNQLIYNENENYNTNNNENYIFHQNNIDNQSNPPKASSFNSTEKNILIFGIIFIIFFFIIACTYMTSEDSNTDNKTTTEIIDPNSIYLNEGKENESVYCKEFILDGEKILTYKIPSGKYKIDVISSNIIIENDIFIEYDDINKNSLGHDEQESAYLIDIQNNQTKITDYTNYHSTKDISKISSNICNKDNIIVNISDDMHIYLAAKVNLKLTKIE